MLAACSFWRSALLFLVSLEKDRRPVYGLKKDAEEKGRNYRKTKTQDRRSGGMMGDKAYRERHKAKGLCVFCSREAAPNHTKCELHLKKNREYNYKYYRTEHFRAIDRRNKLKRRKEGKCLDCGKPLDPDIESDRVVCINCGLHIRRPEHYHYGTLQKENTNRQ